MNEMGIKERRKKGKRGINGNSKSTGYILQHKGLVRDKKKRALSKIKTKNINEQKLTDQL